MPDTKDAFVDWFHPALAHTLKWEGGFFSNPATGEVSNRGITLNFLRAIGKLPKTSIASANVPTADEIAFVRNLTMGATSQLYFDYFWLPQKCQVMPTQALATKLFDLSVNMGNHAAGKLLQQAANKLFWPSNISEDGVIGANTINALNHVDAEQLLYWFASRAADRYTEIAKQPENAHFLVGWLRRLWDGVTPPQL